LDIKGKYEFETEFDPSELEKIAEEKDVTYFKACSK